MTSVPLRHSKLDPSCTVNEGSELKRVAMALVGRGIRLPLARSTALRTVLIRSVASSASQMQMEGYVARNKKLGRPLSPSLGILAQNPNPVWVLSFAHRASASIITPAVSVVSIAYLISGTNFSDFSKFFESIATQNPALWTTCKFMLVLPFTYHCINGLRHLWWDTGRGFTMEFTYRAGYAVFITALLSALGLTFYTPSK